MSVSGEGLPPLRPRAPLNLFHLPRLARRRGRDVVFGGFAFASSLVSIALIGAVADWVQVPLVFPSLGPTAFLIFDHPRAESAAPRNVLLGHALGVGFGYAALAVFGLRHSAPALSGGLPAARVAAVAMSLALTASAMAFLRVPHPPAAATALLVSLGLLTRPSHFAALMAGVVLLVAQGWVLDRLAGFAYPLWHPARQRRART
jgi:CBS-domain-containing membrane protein